MDGNRRFTKAIDGDCQYQHLIGLLKLWEIVNYCGSNITIKYLTLYAFSENNWKRNENEIDSIFNLLEYFLIEYKKNNNNIVVNILTTNASSFTERINSNIKNIRDIASTIKTLNYIVIYY